MTETSEDLADNKRTFPQNTHPANQPDEYVRCPYFPEHELRKSRLPYHLSKCQKNPRAPELVACPFNYMHRVRLEDRQDHIILCEDRIFIKYKDRKPPSYASTRAQYFNIKSTSEQVESKTDQFQQQESTRREEADGEDWWA